MSNNKGFFGSLASALVESQHEIRMAEREQLNKLWAYLKTNHPNFVTGLGLEKSNISLTQFYKKVLKIFIDDPDYPEIQSLLLKTGQHYFAAKYINKPYTLDNLEEVKILLDKKKELQDLIVKIEKNSNEKSFDDFESFKVLMTISKATRVKTSFRVGMVTTPSKGTKTLTGSW